LPLAYEVLAGNTADNTTLKAFVARIERQYGKARRVWCMDRGVPTEEVLAQMRAADPPVHYLVGTPKGRLILVCSRSSTNYPVPSSDTVDALGVEFELAQGFDEAIFEGVDADEDAVVEVLFA